MKLTLSRLDITVFLAYLLAVLVVGMLAARRGSSTKRDYFLSGDKLPWWMIGGSIVASNVSSHHLVGIMGTAYSRGFVAMWIVWGTVLVGFNALLWVFLPYYLRNGFYTMPEFLQRRFRAGARLTYVVNRLWRREGLPDGPRDCRLGRYCDELAQACAAHSGLLRRRFGPPSRLDIP